MVKELEAGLVRKLRREFSELGQDLQRLVREKKQQVARKSNAPPHPTYYERARLIGKKVGKYHTWFLRGGHEVQNSKIKEGSKANLQQTAERLPENVKIIAV